MSRKAVRSWIRAQSRASRLASLPVVFLGLLNTAAGIAFAYALAAALAAGLAGRVPPPPVLALFAVASAVRAALIYAIDIAAFRAGVAGRRRLRGRLVGDLLAVGPALLRQRHSAALATALVDQIEALDGFYGRWLPAAALAVAAPVAVLAVVVQVDPVAAGLLAAVGLLVPFGQAVAGFGIAAASRGQFLALARLQARFLDRIRGIATIVLAGAAEAEAAALALAAAELRRRTMRVLRLAFLSSAVMDVANAAALVAVALHDRSKLAAGGADFTAALFVLLLVPEFFAPLRAFAAAYQDRAHVSGAAQALAELPTPPPPVPAAAIRTITARAIAVHVDDVWFAWDPARPPALAGLSFLVGPGETLVLAGPSGAGKSTIIELLLGFIRPDRGRVLLNGHDIADITPPALAALTAWIGQRPMLFAGTIRDNIRFARPDASEAEVEDAARLAHVAAFAAALPAGLDTPIGEGGHGLSGGQAQRVAIARAYLKQAPLLLLDEPTGHLDPATEQEVLASLRRLAVGRTVIMASHSAAAHALAGRRLDIVGGRVARRSEVA